MKQTKKQFAVCIDNTDYEVSLILGKIYPILPDPKAESHCVFVDFPSSVRKKILALQNAT